MKVKIIETQNKYEYNLEKNHAQDIEKYLYMVNKELKDVQISTSFTKWNFDCEYSLSAISYYIRINKELK